MDTFPIDLRHHFRLKDPRINRRKRHRLIDIITIAICAVIADAVGGGVVRVEDDVVRRSGVRPDDADRLAVGDGPEAQRAVRAAAGERLAVGAERDRGDGAVVAAHREQRLEVRRLRRLREDCALHADDCACAGQPAAVDASPSGHERRTAAHTAAQRDRRSPKAPANTGSNPHELSGSRPRTGKGWSSRNFHRSGAIVDDGDSHTAETPVGMAGHAYLVRRLARMGKINLPPYNQRQDHHRTPGGPDGRGSPDPRSFEQLDDAD